MTKVILISAKAGHGKDTFGAALKEVLELQNKKVLVCHFADFLKFSAKQWFNWNGAKDEFGRHLLQYLGTDVFRHNRPDVWANMLREFILGLGDLVDYVIIPDWRFINERNVFYDDFTVWTIRVVRPNYKSNLTAEQQAHESETSLDHAQFDFVVTNDSTIDALQLKAQSIVNVMEQFAPEQLRIEFSEP